TPVGPEEETPVGPEEETPVGPEEETPVGPEEETPVGPEEETPEEPKEKTPEEPKEKTPKKPETPVEKEPSKEKICGDGICQGGEQCDADCCEAFCTLYCPKGSIEGSCGCECIEPDEPEEECIEEGGQTWSVESNCCEGLKAVSDCLPDQQCPISLRFCVDCGNGKCDSYENWDNCANDCKQKEPHKKQCNEGEERYYRCSDGTKVPECKCESEAWVCVISPKKNCPDSPEPEKCAGEIKLTLNKNTYKIGDPVRMMIEILDSQGNHLPDYEFYAQIYDNRWHTPDLKETDNKGYFIHTGTAEKPSGGVTEVKFKVYTKEVGSCKSVEDTEEAKLELDKCGIGECAPEPGCKDKVRMCGGKCPPCPEDVEKEIFYPCSGCEVEEKCYPYGFRKGGNYCLDKDNKFVPQLADNEKCENNFECQTNLCINGNCVSSNVWNKFIKWFGNIFGKGDGPGPEAGSKICSELLIEEDIGNNEYEKSGYGENKHARVPVYSEDGTNIRTIKCCTADYLNGGVTALGCSFDNREDLRNSIKWIFSGGVPEGEHKFIEYNGERIIEIGDRRIIVWTNKAYLIATGRTSDTEKEILEEIADAYLQRFKSDLDLTEDDLPYIPPTSLPDEKPSSFVFCTEEDKVAAKECGHRGGAPQSNPSTFDGTEGSKKDCIKSKGHGEGCCEVYTGCIMPDQNCEEIEIVSRDECYWNIARLNNDVDLCEKIDDNSYKNKCLRDFITTIQKHSECGKIDDAEHRNKCYVNIAEQKGDSDICDNVDDADLREKCYFWASEHTEQRNVCNKISDMDMRERCYTGEFPLISCKSTEDTSNEGCYFFDSFDADLENWVFNSVEGGKGTIAKEGSNNVLRLYGVVQPEIQRHWDNHFFKFKFKRIEGSMHVNFRKTSRHEGQSRYIVAMSENVNNLDKHFNVYSDENWLILDEAGFSLDDGWHTLEIRGHDNILNVYVDDELLYKYKDTENPFLYGMPGFEIHTGGRSIIPEFLIDDVEIKFITEDDVVYP
ncbi:hypothetical protein KY366_03485, partial [Candidatus Woesearchaeota archaeon]|nr:hypothetical protein [Candidatus Woesearchaeota archaeon]